MPASPAAFRGHGLEEAMPPPRPGSRSRSNVYFSRFLLADPKPPGGANSVGGRGFAAAAAGGRGESKQGAEARPRAPRTEEGA